MGKNIVLIGISGCGKTSIGNLLAKKLNYEFIDTDEVVESYGMTIEELFESGEQSFRLIETIAVKQVASYSDVVISTGGGVVTKEENMELLKQNSVIVFILRDINRIKKSLEKQRTVRPLLTDEDALDKLYFKRLSLYEKYADIVVENNGSLYKACDEIIKKLEEM